MTGTVRLEYDGAIAVITNDNPAKHNACDDAMDFRLWEILAELQERRDIRAIIWRGEGKSFSSGRDVASIGGGQVKMSHHELMSAGHRGMELLLGTRAPIVAALKGWTIGGSFERALMCDIRIASDDARFMLPEVNHGVIPDTGGVARLFQICGPGVASDLVLTGRVMDAKEAFTHGIVSRVVSAEKLDDTVWEIARHIAGRPAVTVKMARRVIRHLAEPAVRASMAEELIAQTFVVKSDDFDEFRQARLEKREPRYTGS